MTTEHTGLPKILILGTAAGYGKRLAEKRGIRSGRIDKPMQLDPEHPDRGRLIEHFLSFAEYARQHENVDIAVLRRNERMFDPGNKYLRQQHPGVKVVYQTVPPMSHLIAVFAQYYGTMFGVDKGMFRYTERFDHVVVMPADHRLDTTNLDLGELLEQHIQTRADVTKVYSHGWGDDVSTNEWISTYRDHDHDRITFVMRENMIRRLLNTPGKQVTSVGVWAFNIKQTLHRPYKATIPLLGFTLFGGSIGPGARLFAHYIDNWRGGVH